MTIDLDLQRVAEEAIGERAGALVAIDPNTGYILAMASHPAFDPNIFAGGITVLGVARTDHRPEPSAGESVDSGHLSAGLDLQDRR